MSLFFYGLVDLDGMPDCEALIRQEAKREGFPVTFGGFSSEYSLADLFGETESFLRPLNLIHAETRSFASYSGSSSNFGHNRSTIAIASPVIRAMNSWHATRNAFRLAWQ